MSGNPDPRSSRVEHSARIGGGGSARLIALAVLVVLVGVVAIGVLGREPTPPPQVAQVPTAASTQAAATPRPTPPSPLRTAPPRAPVAALPPWAYGTRLNDGLVVVLEVAEEVYLAPLERISNGRWYVAYRIEYPRAARDARISLVHVPSGQSEGRSFARWSISLDPMTPERARSEVVLDVTRPAQPEDRAPELVRSGFRVTATAESRLDFGLLRIRVQQSDEIELSADYAIDVAVGRFSTRVDLAVVAPGQLSGLLVLPERLGAEVIELTLNATSTRSRPTRTVSLHTFKAALPRLDEFYTSSAQVSGEIEELAYQYRFTAAPSPAAGGRAFAVHVQVSRATAGPSIR